MIFGNCDRRQMPQLNTASLPDLIFTVLFFFMVVTHMRTVTLKVSFRVPQGTELTRLTKKTAVSYVYIGRPAAAPVQGKAASGYGNNGFQTLPDSCRQSVIACRTKTVRARPYPSRPTVRPQWG